MAKGPNLIAVLETRQQQHEDSLPGRAGAEPGSTGPAAAAPPPAATTSMPPAADGMQPLAPVRKAGLRGKRADTGTDAHEDRLRADAPPLRRSAQADAVVSREPL